MQEQNATFILGRHVGADRGRSDVEQTIVLNGFEPLLGLALPAGEVSFHLRTGHATTYDAAGAAVDDVDFMPAIAGL